MADEQAPQGQQHPEYSEAWEVNMKKLLDSFISDALNQANQATANTGVQITDATSNSNVQNTDATGRSNRQASDLDANNALIGTNATAFSNDRNRQSLDVQSTLNAQYFRMVEDLASESSRRRQNATTADHQVDVAAGTIQHLINAQALTAQGVTSGQLADNFESIAEEAIDAAMGQTYATGAPAEGTTGTAAGATQAGIAAQATVNTALLTTLADMNRALGVILMKVTGEETTSPDSA
jgi:hypothetical protein